jgi:hypothetical protein
MSDGGIKEKMPARHPKLPPAVTRYTYHHHLRAEIFNNLFLGIFGLYEAVARKALGASDLEIVVLSTCSAAFSVLAFVWGSVIGYALTALFNLGVVYLTASAFFLSAALLMSRLKPKPSGAA